MIELLNELIKLLSENDEKEWVGKLRRLLFKYSEPERKAELAMLIINLMSGGMGSLSDLVLQQAGKALIKENEKLDFLLDKLYEECKKYTDHTSE